MTLQDSYISSSDKAASVPSAGQPDEQHFSKLFISMRYWLLGSRYFLALDALEFAACVHTRLRKDGVTREFAHQLEIGHFVRTLTPSLQLPEETLATVFLHDACEDYDVAPGEVEARFGAVVRHSVWLLTKTFGGVSKTPVDYYREIATCPIASIVKGADRVHNVQTMIGVFSAKKQQEYILETQSLILPCLKDARRRFPRQELAYENTKHMLQSQLELLAAVRVRTTRY